MAEKAKKQEKGSSKKGRWGMYETSGGLKRKNKFCPKCGQGTYMAKHKDRYYCGTCHYTEFIKV